jgi:RHS repeat-associated protein
LTFYQVPADASYSVSPSSAGASVNIATTVPGQNAQVTFQGTTGEQVSVDSSNWGGYGVCDVNASLLNPDGSTLVTQDQFNQGCGNSNINAVTLPQTGTYTLLIDPQGDGTGTGTLTFYQVAADASGSISIGGAAVPMTIGTPGRNGGLSFGGTTGTGIHLIAGSDTISGANFSILNPDRSTLTSSSFGTSGGTLSATLGTTGAFSAVVDPQGSALGQMRLTLTDPPTTRAQVARAKRLFAVSSRRTLRRQSLVHPRRAGAAPRARRSASRRVRGRNRRVDRPLVRFTTADPPIWTPSRKNFGGDWQASRVPSPWSRLGALDGRAGATALAGQALELNGQPLAGVRMEIEGTDVQARTDATGRFMLSSVPPGHRVLDVEGGSVGGRGPGFGSFQFGVNVQKGRTSVLPFTIWMQPLDPANAVAVSSPTRRAVTLTTPHIPGLEVRIPAGSTITAPNGQPVKKLSIVAVPVDRPPFPLPMGSYFPVYLSVQPADAYVSRGAEIIYPNFSHLPAGQRVPFWNYDPESRGWYVYGEGTVSSDGKQIVPDPGVRVWRFSGAMISGSLVPPWLKNFFEGLIGADPVNLGSGMFTYQKTDLQLPDVLPIALTRTYRPGDTNSYSFGIGMTNSYDMRLFSQNNYQSTELILPDGMDIHYVRTSSGTGWTDAVYQAQSTPTEFYGSTIVWDPSNGYDTGVAGWDLRLRNGVTYFFAEEQAYGLSSIRDRFGNLVTISRDSAGNLLQVTSPNGRWISFQHDSDNRITQATDNSGRTVKYDYNGQTGPSACSSTTSTGPSGTLRCVKDANGNETYYTYDPTSGWMTQIKDARGNTLITNVYDANGRVTQQTVGNDSTPYTFSYVLNGSGLVTQSTMTSPNGNQTVTNLDANGFPSSVTAASGTPLAETTSYQRQPGTDFLLSETDQLGRETKFGYDTLGNLSSVTEDATGANPRTTTTVYAPTFSLATQVTDPWHHVTSYSYDSTGELTQVTDPLLNKTKLTYANGDGQPTTITDPLQNKTTYGYSLGDLTTVTDPNGNVTSDYLDAGGRLVSSTNPLGNTTQYAYDSLNDLTSVTDPDGHQTKYGYDADGDLQTITDANNNVTTLGYDNEDRLHTREDALNNTWTYNYDNDDNLTSVQDPKGQTITNTPDALDRLSSTVFKASGGQTQSTVNYTYDLGNRLTKVADSTGGTFTETPDNFDELTQESGPNGTISYTYNPDGTRATSTVTGQPQISYGYDPDSRLTSISGAGQTVGLSYDNASRPQQTKLSNGITENYTYDPASQLTDILYDNSTGSQIGDLHYAYDSAGNRTAEWGSYARLTIPQAWGTSPVYNADNELTSNGSTTYQYDQNGNLATDGTNTYTWNVRNQLTAIAGASTSNFTYDPFGRREQKTINGTSTNFLYDGQNVVQDLSGNTPQTNYLLGLGLDQRYSRTDSTGTQSYLTDALGSTLALANSDQSLPTSYTYDPFGQTSTTGTSSTNPYQYTGRENDNTGLQYNRARYYNPALGTFTSQDPLGQSGSGPNLYQYASQDPTNQTDPTGESSLLSGPGLCLAQVVSGAKDGAAAWGCGASTVIAGIIGVEGVLGEGAVEAVEGAEDGGSLLGDTADAAESCDTNSFTAQTPVLLANGEKVAISMLKVGNYVEATDPTTGVSGPHRVLRVINDSGIKEMVNVTLADGESLQATAHHPFWDATSDSFEYATDLHVGDQLQDADGTTIAVTGLQRFTAYEHVYNLTVQGIHTFYVGTDPVLVHNSCWSTARRQYWADNGPGAEAPTRNVLVQDSSTGQVYQRSETMELHHIIPRSAGGSDDPSNLAPLWPTDHAAADPYRFPGYAVLQVLLGQ